ncbi:hypothetical protein thalar_02202 [Litoreibacter arenae DSM 19593]|uniref:Uncharacterized protein n=1 Tax=Litoreibacter arenae DSM 19593 TaxID=1123360 RepID=S9QHR6_9RHOB|nr:hypothetical protein thalar_02202 [Litoreibacter arenae DSM 19593]
MVKIPQKAFQNPEVYCPVLPIGDAGCAGPCRGTERIFNIVKCLYRFGMT